VAFIADIDMANRIKMDKTMFQGLSKANYATVGGTPQRGGRNLDRNRQFR
jgi:hypothetical protein